MRPFLLFPSLYLQSLLEVLSKLKRLRREGSSTIFHARLADLILDSLTNIHRELKFFEDVAKRYGLNIDAGDNVSKGVEAYRKLFFETGESIENGTISFLEGMVLLWGTEKVCSLLFHSYFESCSRYK